MFVVAPPTSQGGVPDSTIVCTLPCMNSHAQSIASVAVVDLDRYAEDGLAAAIAKTNKKAATLVAHRGTAVSPAEPQSEANSVFSLGKNLP